MNKTILGTVIILALLILGNAAYSYLNNSPRTERVSVSTFYDGKDGYSIAIPTGNTSTCIWNYVGGNAAIPYSEITEARTATSKHIIYIYDDYSDWMVTCVDDFGNHYTGIFPKD